MDTKLDPTYFKNLFDSLAKDEAKNAADFARFELEKRKIQETKVALESLLKMASTENVNSGSINFLNANVVAKADSATHTKPISGLQLQTYDLIEAGENVDVKTVYLRATASGIETTKASINTSMSILARKGLLEKPSIGVYGKPQKAENPSAINTEASIVQPSHPTVAH